MKIRKVFLMLFFIWGGFSTAQNLSTLPLVPGTLPVSDCNITFPLVIRHIIRNNSASTWNGGVDLRYTIHYGTIGGPVVGVPVTENYANPISPGSTLTYAFLQTFNPMPTYQFGTFWIHFEIVVPGNIGSPTYFDYSFDNFEPSNAYSVTAPTPVCATPGNVSLNITPAPIGTVQKWQKTTVGCSAGGASWTTLSGTSLPQTDNIVATTYFRVIVKNGLCPADTSNSCHTITLDPITVAGSMGCPSASVCSGTNTGTITLSGHVGSISGWDYSTDGGMTWIPIAATAGLTNYTFNNLTQTTRYRASVKNGTCATLLPQITIYVFQPSVAGTLATTSPLTVCNGVTVPFTLTSATGTVRTWQTSTDCSTWANSTFPNKNPSVIILPTYFFAGVPLTTSACFRVEVANGVCPSVFSNSINITVSNAAAKSPLTGPTKVCKGTNSGTITLGALNGGNTIVNWRSSIDNVVWTPFTPINSTNTYKFTDLAETTRYLVEVTSPGCPNVFSDTATVTVEPASIGGKIKDAKTVCPGSTDSLRLTGYVGNVLKWQSSDELGLKWTDIQSTIRSIQYTNIQKTTYYRALVQKGTCEIAKSDSLKITVYPLLTTLLGNDTTIDRGQEIPFNTSGNNCVWTPTDGLSDDLSCSPIAKPSNDVSYIVETTDANNCVIKDSINITVVPTYKFLIPNLITQNGDGKNDKWEVKSLESYLNNEVYIYNRNGMLVYQAKPYVNEWDGANLPTGTYFYLIKFSDSPKTFQGGITLIR